MADSLKFELKGASEVAAALKTLTTNQRAKVYLKMNRNAANVVKKRLQAASPSDKIRKAVKVEKSKTNTTGVVIGFMKKAFHVKFLEFGTAIRTVKGKRKGRFKGANRGKMTPRPFVERTHDQAGSELQVKLGETYKEEMNKALNAELKKVNNKIKKLGV